MPAARFPGIPAPRRARPDLDWPISRSPKSRLVPARLSCNSITSPEDCRKLRPVIGNIGINTAKFLFNHNVEGPALRQRNNRPHLSSIRRSPFSQLFHWDRDPNSAVQKLKRQHRCPTTLANRIQALIRPGIRWLPGTPRDVPTT
jgi:hypothetical protein